LKKIIRLASSLLVFCLLSTAAVTPSFAATESPKLTINGTTVNSKTYLQQGNLMVPMRELSEKLGLKVLWVDSNSSKNGVTGFAGLQTPSSTILFSPGQDNAVVFDHKVERLKYGAVKMDTCSTSTDIDMNIKGEHSNINAFTSGDNCGADNQTYWEFDRIKLPSVVTVEDGVLYIPLRFFSEASGVQVDYNQVTNAVTVTGNSTYDHKIMLKNLYDTISKLVKDTGTTSRGGIHVSKNHLYMNLADLAAFYDQQLRAGMNQLYLGSLEGKNYYYVDDSVPNLPIISQNGELITLPKPQHRYLTAEESNAFLLGKIKELPDTTLYDTALLVHMDSVSYLNNPGLENENIKIKFSTDDGNEYFMTLAQMLFTIKFKGAFRSLDNPSDDGW
jgi:hypothetical protein